MQRVAVIDTDVHQGNGPARDKLHFQDEDLAIVDVYNCGAQLSAVLAGTRQIGAYRCTHNTYSDARLQVLHRDTHVRSSSLLSTGKLISLPVLRRHPHVHRLTLGCSGEQEKTTGCGSVHKLQEVLQNGSAEAVQQPSWAVCAILPVSQRLE